jgi:hypothetical protein
MDDDGLKPRVRHAREAARRLLERHDLKHPTGRHGSCLYAGVRLNYQPSAVCAGKAARRCGLSAEQIPCALLLGP